MKYNFDFTKHIRNSLPVKLRKEKTMALLSSFLYPIHQLYNQFLDFVNLKRYELNTTSQTFSLITYLNDRFDKYNRRIYITNQRREYFYLYNESELQVAKYLYWESEDVEKRSYLYNEIEGGNVNFTENFRVWIPYDLEELNSQVEAHVNKYKAAGRNMKIVNYVYDNSPPSNPPIPEEEQDI